MLHRSPPRRAAGRALRSVSFHNTKSGGRREYLLLDCRAKACTEGVFFTDTGMVATPPRGGPRPRG